jgi:hypothetical protein
MSSRDPTVMNPFYAAVATILPLDKIFARKHDF